MSKKIFALISLALILTVFSNAKIAQAETAKPDLIISGIAASAADRSITVTLKNAGPVKAMITNSVISVAYGSSSNIATTIGIVTNNISNIWLDPGEEKTFLFNDQTPLLPPEQGTAPSFINFSDGVNYVITASADINHVVDESDENNNSLSVPYSVQTIDEHSSNWDYQDVAIAAIWPYAPQQFIQVNLKNLGTLPADISNAPVRVTYSQVGGNKEYDATINAGFLGKNTLAPNEEYVLEFNRPNYLLAAINFVPGKSYTVTAAIDTSNSPVSEANQDNNQLTVAYLASGVVEHSSNFDNDSTGTETEDSSDSDSQSLNVYEVRAAGETKNFADIYFKTDGDYTCTIKYSNSENLTQNVAGRLVQYGTTGNGGEHVYNNRLLNLIPGNKYYYQIVCHDSSGKSKESSVYNFNTLADYEDVVISDINLSALAGDAVKINWKTNVNTSYNFVMLQESGSNTGGSHNEATMLCARFVGPGKLRSG